MRLQDPLGHVKPQSVALLLGRIPFIEHIKDIFPFFLADSHPLVRYLEQELPVFKCNPNRNR